MMELATLTSSWFEYPSRSFQLTETEQCFYLVQSLCGVTDQILAGYTKEPQNYAELAQQLRQGFSTQKSPEQARLELQSRKQQENATLQELAGDIQHRTVLCAPQVSYEERERYLGVPVFLEALTDNRLRLELRKKPFGTVDEALEEALHL